MVTEGGYAKRTAADQYRLQNRGGLGIKVAKLNDDRGDLVGASSSTSRTKCSWSLRVAR